MSTENSKAAVILARCAILGPATAVFRFIVFIVYRVFLKEQSLNFADPRDQAIAAALHACTHNGEDLFQELSVRGSVPGFVLLTVPRDDEFGIPGTPVTVGKCLDTSRKFVAASGSPSTKSK